MKKKNIIIFTLLMTFLLSNIAFATQYYITSSEDIEAYGYGCDFNAEVSAVISSNGIFEDVSGVKVRCKVYRNNTKVTDTSDYDTTSPYNASVNESCTSSSYSNSWEMETTDYVKEGNETSYSPVVSVTISDEN